MKVSHFFYTVLTVFLFSCNGQNTNNPFAEAGNTTMQNNYRQDTNFKRANKQGFKTYNIMDKQLGISSGSIQIPVSWVESNNKKENILFEGPHGLKVYNNVSEYSRINAPVKSIEQFLNENIKPLANKDGAYMTKKYPLPEMVQFNRKLESLMFKAIPAQKQMQCIATEWENKNGTSSLVIIQHFISRFQTGTVSWGYTINSLEVEKPYFEEAKNTYINSLLNFQINPQWVQASNQYWSQKTQQATVAHNRRMKAIEDFGRTNTARYNQRMAESDAQFNSWRASQATNDASHSRFVDGIWEQRNMTNPNTGQTYKIQGYDNNVWMNQNNQYFGTDNSLYNPNLDNTINEQNWDRLEDDNN